MSLEQALAANTAALQALTATLSNNPQLGAHFTAAVAPVPTAPVASTDSSPAPTSAFAPPAPTQQHQAATAAPLTGSPAASGERDSKGMPWDGRIHSATKAKVADGSWRYKRGCPEPTVVQIEQEIRTALAAPAPASMQAAPAPAGGVGTPWPFPDAVASPPSTPATTLPPPVVPPPPTAGVAVPLPPVAGSGLTYEALMAALPPKIVAGEITATALQQACETFGIPSIAALATRPDLVQSVAAMLGLK